VRTSHSTWPGRSALALVASCGVVAGLGVQPVDRTDRPPSQAQRIVASLEANSVRDERLVEAFDTDKTFTVARDGETKARVVAALRFTAPDVKVFTVLESGGSNFIRTRVIDKMMATEIELARSRSRTRAAISSDNYEFGPVREDGDAFVIETLPRRQDEFLVKGRVWITKDGFHLKRIEGEPARSPSFWTRHIRFVSEFGPVDGVWVPVRTMAWVTVRWVGEYQVQAVCGPYRMSLGDDRPSEGPDSLPLRGRRGSR
jgi:hypothetical protein